MYSVARWLSLPGRAAVDQVGKIMNDMEAQLEKLRRDAGCAIVRDLATDQKKRELFTRLANHLSALASEVERAIAKGQ
jgi:hypothetical protein